MGWLLLSSLFGSVLLTLQWVDYPHSSIPSTTSWGPVGDLPSPSPTHRSSSKVYTKGNKWKTPYCLQDGFEHPAKLCTMWERTQKGKLRL